MTVTSRRRPVRAIILILLITSTQGYAHTSSESVLINTIQTLQFDKAIKLLTGQKPAQANLQARPSESKLDTIFAGKKKKGFQFFRKSKSIKTPSSPTLTASLSPNLDINAFDANLNTVLILAIKSRHPLLIQTLLDQNPDVLPVNQNGDSALMWAIESEMFDFVPALLEMQANPNQANKEGRTPILLAGAKGKFKLVQLLADHGGSLTCTSKSGSTLLHFAAAKYRPMDADVSTDETTENFFDYLLKQGLDVNQKDTYGMTPLMHAVKFGNLSAVTYLLKAPGIQLELENDKGQTALSVSFENELIFNTLLAGGADLEHVNEAGRTPLLTAAAEGSFRLAKKLIDSGADIDATDKKGKGLLAFSKFKTFAAQLIKPPPVTLYDYLEVKKQVQARLVLLGNPTDGANLQDELDEIVFLGAYAQKSAQNIYIQEAIEKLVQSNPVTRQCIVCLEDQTILEKDATGPANCSCFLCDDCSPGFVKRLLNMNEGKLSVCPNCKGLIRPDYLESKNVTKAEQSRFFTRQLAYGNLLSPGWTPCPTESCIGGKILVPTQEAYYNCAFCDWSGCLNCRTDHHGADCARLTEEEQTHQAKLKKLIELGKLTPEPNVTDPTDDRYYHGRFRPCYHCGIMTEKYEGCMSMVCGQCKKDWHWNRGVAAGHTSENALQQYEPLFPAHF